jgi:uncharacterized protein YoxC
MRRTSNRFAGAVLLLGAGLGIVISLLGIAGVWMAVPKAAVAIDGTIDKVQESLNTTQSGLAIMADSMRQAKNTILVMETSADEIAHSVDQTVPMVDRASSLLGEQMTSIVRQTQTSLNAAQSSAKLVDDTLSLITALPFIGKRYTPSTSLSSSISGVSQSLDALPDSFLELQGNLKTSSDNLRTMQGQVNALGANLHEISSSVDEAQGVVESYQSQVTGLQADLQKFQDRYPAWLTWIKWGLTLFFVWLGIAQVGLILQGAALLAGQGAVVVPAAREEGKVEGV